jgi:hypothetical protein
MPSTRESKTSRPSIKDRKKIAAAIALFPKSFKLRFNGGPYEISAERSYVKKAVVTYTCRCGNQTQDKFQSDAHQVSGCLVEEYELAPEMIILSLWTRVGDLLVNGKEFDLEQIRDKIELCRNTGDFGYTNIWGTPYLMTSVYCSKPWGHDGPHEGVLDTRVVPSFEPDGRKIKKETVKVKGTTTVEWENNE